MISISIVSHGQGELIKSLLSDLVDIAQETHFELILTKNIPEHFSFAVDGYPFFVTVIENDKPKGFGANHNQAFQKATGAFFCVMNPDIRIAKNPFPHLLATLAETDAVVVAPMILSPNGGVEDSVRRFPTPLNLLAKLFRVDDGRYKVPTDKKPYSADWVGGMFMLFRTGDYLLINGFDEAYFLYYEDVDICTRFWKQGRQVFADPSVSVTHDARRTSRRNLRYVVWHITSMMRYLLKHPFPLAR